MDLGTAAVLAVGSAAFLTQDYWIPKPPLVLSSSQVNGNLVIRWNVDALRKADNASLLVNDGGTLQSLPLDRFEVNQGVFIYVPKSQRVTAKLSVGGASAIATWFAPAPAAPPPEAAPAFLEAPPATTEEPKKARPPRVIPDDR